MRINLGSAARIEAFFARLVMIVMAAGIAYWGYALITRPLAIPVAIVLWLGATAIFFLGVWGTLPDDDDQHEGHARP